jgi:hypothetical protein
MAVSNVLHKAATCNIILSEQLLPDGENKAKIQNKFCVNVDYDSI